MAATSPDRHPLLPCCGRRFVKFGGGVSAEQLAWLQVQLEGCAAAGERVLVACHLCFHPRTCPPACLLWNYEEVLQVGRQPPGRVEPAARRSR